MSEPCGLKGAHRVHRCSAVVAMSSSDSEAGDEVAMLREEVAALRSLVAQHEAQLRCLADVSARLVEGHRGLKRPAPSSQPAADPTGRAGALRVRQPPDRSSSQPDATASRASMGQPGQPAGPWVG